MLRIAADGGLNRIGRAPVSLIRSIPISIHCTYTMLLA
jgi:hypothetical protein